MTGRVITSFLKCYVASQLYRLFRLVLVYNKLYITNNLLYKRWRHCISTDGYIQLNSDLPTTNKSNLFNSTCTKENTASLKLYRNDCFNLPEIS